MRKEFSDDIKTRVLTALEFNEGNIEKTAHQLGMSTAQVRRIDVNGNQRRNWTPEGRGKKELYPYIVAVRDCEETSSWDNNDPKIMKAREDYDMGLTNMFTAIDGMNIILYSVPLNQPDPSRPTYFSNIQKED